MRWTVSLLLVLTAAMPAISQPVEPPKPKAGPLIPVKLAAVAGQPVCIDASSATSKVEWDFAFDPKNVIKDGKKLYFASAVDGIYKITIVYIDGDAPKLDRCEITVGKAPVPTPTPTPTPTPSPDGSLASLTKLVSALTAKVDAGFASQQKKIDDGFASMDARVKALEQTPPVVPGKPAVSLTFVFLAPTQTTANVTEDTLFRDWLKSNKLAIYGLTTQAQIDANPRFKGIAPPCVVLQDATGNVIGTRPITTVDAAKAFVTTHLK